MSQKSLVPPSLQSIKSLPGDCSFMGTPASDPLGRSDDRNSGNSDILSSSTPGNGVIWEEAVERVEDNGGNMDHANEDSPYSGNMISVEDRPSNGCEDLDTVALPVPSISASRSDYRWGDTTSYAAKKVYCRFWFSFTFLHQPLELSKYSCQVVFYLHIQWNWTIRFSFNMAWKFLACGFFQSSNCARTMLCSLWCSCAFVTWWCTYLYIIRPNFTHLLEVWHNGLVVLKGLKIWQIHPEDSNIFIFSLKYNIQIDVLIHLIKF